MQTGTSQTVAIVSLPLLLILGWVIVAFVTAYGMWRRSSRLLAWGVTSIGLMTLVTPLAWYLYAASRADGFSIGVMDVLILGLLAFLGGGVLVFGLTLRPRGPSAAAKR